MKIQKRLWALVLCLAMVMSLMPVSGVKAEEVNGTITVDARHTTGQNDEMGTFATTDNEDGSITVQANPKEGYQVEGWYTDQDGIGVLEPNDTIVINNDKTECRINNAPSNMTIYVKFEQSKPSVSVYHVSDQNDEMGTFATTDNENGSVTIQAIPAEGYQVEGWYKDVDGTEELKDETILAEMKYCVISNIKPGMKIYVKFKKIVCRVEAANVEGQSSNDVGTVKVSLNEVEYGNSVSIIAEPETGYEVEGWYSDLQGENRLVFSDDVQLSGKNTCIITVKSNRSVYVKFKKIEIQVVAGIVQGTDQWGTVEVSSQSQMVEYGGQAVIYAKAKEGYQIEGWYRNPDGTDKIETDDGITMSKDKTECTISNIQSEIQVYVKFKTKVFEVSAELVNGQDESYGKVEVSQTLVEFGKKVVVRAKAEPGYEVEGWYSDPNGENKLTNSDDISVSSNECIITIRSERKIYVKFMKKRFSVNVGYVEGQNHEWGEVTTFTNPIEFGSPVTIQAKPFEQYQVEGWYANEKGTEKISGEDISITPDQTTCILNSLQSDINIYVKFKKKRFNVNVYHILGQDDTMGTISVKESPVEYGLEANLTATAREGYWIEGWYSDEKGTQKLEGENIKISDDKASCMIGNVKSQINVYVKFGWHQLDKTEAVAATCTEAGNKEYYTCTVCKKHFSDAEGKNEVEEGSWIIPALPHQLDKIGAVAATCTEAGNTEYYTCTVCKKHFSDAEGKNEVEEGSWIIPALLHQLEKKDAVDATCTEAGNTEYYTCTVCKKHFSDAEGKNEVEEGSWIIPALPHQLVKTEAVAATCTKAGNKEYYTCSVCKKYFSDAEGKNEVEEGSWIIPALPHQLAKTEAVAATCTEAGNIEYYSCSACGKYFSDAKGTKEAAENSWVIKAKGHHLVEKMVKKRTAKKEGLLTQSCDVCKAVIKEIVLPSTTKTIVLGKSAKVISNPAGCTFKLANEKKYNKYFKLNRETGKITTKKNSKVYKNVSKSIPVDVTVGGRSYKVKVKLKIPAPTIKIIRTKAGIRDRYTFKYNVPNATKIKVRTNVKGINNAGMDRYVSKPKSDDESYVNINLGNMKKVRFKIVAYYGKKTSETRVIIK